VMDAVADVVDVVDVVDVMDVVAVAVVAADEMKALPACGSSYATITSAKKNGNSKTVLLTPIPQRLVR